MNKQSYCTNKMMETNKRVLDNCGKCLFCVEERDMGARWYSCELPKGIGVGIIMCENFAGNCPYFFSKDIINVLKKPFIEMFKEDGTQKKLAKIAGKSYREEI